MTRNPSPYFFSHNPKLNILLLEPLERNITILPKVLLIFPYQVQFLAIATRWAPTSYKWSYNPYKWPYKWVTGVITPISGVITILITGRGPTL